MKGAALLWWRTAHQDFQTFDQFEEAFKMEFWSVLKQCEIRTRLYADRYNEEGPRSLEEQFVVNWERSRHLQPPMEDAEFICMLVAQLPVRLKHLLIHAHRGTILQLREDLRKIDQIEWERRRDYNEGTRGKRKGEEKDNPWRESQSPGTGPNSQLQEELIQTSDDNCQPPSKRNKKFRNNNRGQNQQNERTIVDNSSQKSN